MNGREEINAKGGIKKNKLVLSFEDSGAKTRNCPGRLFEKLIDYKKHRVIVGEYTSACVQRL